MMNLDQITNKIRKISMEIPRSKEYHVIESYNALRTNLLLKCEDIKSIAMVGSEAEEGTTYVTWNLAVSLAEIDRKVLIIDADMRNSVMADRYHIKYIEKGLSEYLSGECQLEESIYQTPFDNLYVISAGESTGHPSELLSGHRFADLINKVKKEFDYVLVDCPPLASAIDGAIVAEVCDASVIIARADRVKRAMLQSVKLQLEKANHQILGVVLNGFNSKRYKCYGNYNGKLYGKD